MRRSVRLGAAAAAALPILILPASAAGQPKDAVPRFPAGVPVVVLPVQAALPTPGGAWPAGLPAEEEVLAALDAELTFALGERREAARWAAPEQVVRRAGRNPLLGVDPRRVAYQGLLEPIKGQLYEPLHGQLRALAALFDARFVVLPMAVGEGVAPPPDGTVGACGETGSGEPAEDGEPCPRRRHATLLLAVVDVRRSQVLWHGEIVGDPAPAGSPGVLASLAQRVAGTLTGGR